MKIIIETFDGGRGLVLEREDGLFYSQQCPYTIFRDKQGGFNQFGSPVDVWCGKKCGFECPLFKITKKHDSITVTLCKQEYTCDSKDFEIVTERPELSRDEYQKIWSKILSDSSEQEKYNNFNDYDAMETLKKMVIIEPEIIEENKNGGLKNENMEG